MSVVLCLQCGTLSESPTFCDTCGTKFGEASPASAPVAAVAASPASSAAASERPEWHPEWTTCPEAHGGCGAVRQGLGPFCKLCGFNFKLLQPSAGPTLAPAEAASRPAAPPSRSQARKAPLPVTLKAVVSCDPQLYEALHPQDRRELTFPYDAPTVEFLITGSEVLIGRLSRHNPVQPQIIASTDPGVSRQHAKLLLQPNGTYAILDTASAGGTLLNGEPIQGKLMPIRPGDVLVLGAWTRIDILAR